MKLSIRCSDLLVCIPPLDLEVLSEFWDRHNLKVRERERRKIKEEENRRVSLEEKCCSRFLGLADENPIVLRDSRMNTGGKMTRDEKMLEASL